MGFDVSADSYAAFMGRYSEPLAARFVALAQVRAGQRVLDVGCGPGALTAVLVERCGAESVSAIDPSEPFVAAVRSRLPGVHVQLATAERVPFADASFDLAMAQLVVHFMQDPLSGLREMARVTRPGGLVAACVWDHGGDGGPLSVFWRAARELDPQAPDEAALPGAREGHSAELFEQAGLQQVEAAALSVRVSFAGLEEWWQPFTLGVGPAGGYVAGLAAAERRVLKLRCAELLPDPPFEIIATAWTVLGRVPA